MKYKTQLYLLITEQFVSYGHVIDFWPNNIKGLVIVYY